MAGARHGLAIDMVLTFLNTRRHTNSNVFNDWTNEEEDVERKRRNKNTITNRSYPDALSTN